MRRSVWLVSALIALGAMGCRASQPIQRAVSEPAQAGPAKMPAFSFKDLSGRDWDSSSFKNKTVLMEFWATWCGPCRELAPDLHDFYKRNKGRVQMLSVSLDEKESTVRAFVKDRPFLNPVIHAGSSLAKGWELKQIPALALIRDQRIVFIWVGRDAIRQALPALENEIL